jgi:hypothetical protein
MSRRCLLQCGSLVILVCSISNCTLDTQGTAKAIFDDIPDSSMLDQSTEQDALPDTNFQHDSGIDSSIVDSSSDVSLDTAPDQILEDSSQDTLSEDSAPDVVQDADGGIDSSPDTAIDSATDAPTDTLQDTVVDSQPDTSDSATDSGADVSTEAEAGTVHAQSCSELQTGTGTTGTTLYLNHDPQKPFSAICRYGNNGATTYLVLPAGNTSTYPLGSCAVAGTGLVTTWNFVKFDPATLMVDTSDYEGAVSSGSTFEKNSDSSAQHLYAKMPFGSARNCVDSMPSTPQASIDLSGTHFSIAATQIWFPVGYSSSGVKHLETFGIGRQTASISVGGYPGGISPCTNDYYTLYGGNCLQLSYTP